MTMIGVHPDGSLREIPRSTSTGEDDGGAQPAAAARFDLGGQAGPFGLEVFGELGARLGALTDALEADMRTARGRRSRVPPEAVTPLYIPATPIAISSGAGSLDQKQLFGPTLGRTWDIYSAIAYGYTAGTVQAFRNGIDLAIPWAAAGEITYGKLQKVIRASERLTFTASGITLASGFAAVMVSIAGVSVLDAYWSDYAL